MGSLLGRESRMCFYKILYFTYIAQGGVIIASHDESLITHVCNEVWLCGNGSIKRLEGIEEYKKLIEGDIST